MKNLSTCTLAFAALLALGIATNAAAQAKPAWVRLGPEQLRISKSGGCVVTRFKRTQTGWVKDHEGHEGGRTQAECALSNASMIKSGKGVNGRENAIAFTFHWHRADRTLANVLGGAAKPAKVNSRTITEEDSVARTAEHNVAPQPRLRVPAAASGH